MLNGLSLFSGIGGLDIALSDWVRPIFYCEIEPYCQAVLLSRITERNLANAPIWDDIRNLYKKQIKFTGEPEVTADGIDIIYGGFP
jgi:site-specific DNA-cytosine methylase